MKNKEEKQYFDLIQKILDEGYVGHYRTGTGANAIFGIQMRFSLGESDCGLRIDHPKIAKGTWEFIYRNDLLPERNVSMIGYF